MKIVKSGYLSERKLTIEANDYEEGFLIDKLHSQIQEHMKKIKFSICVEDVE